MAQVTRQEALNQDRFDAMPNGSNFDCFCGSAARGYRLSACYRKIDADTIQDCVDGRRWKRWETAALSSMHVMVPYGAGGSVRDYDARANHQYVEV